MANKESTMYDEIEQKIKEVEKAEIDIVETKEEIPKYSKVVTGDVTLEPKKSLFKRLIIGFVGPNGIKSIFGYLGREIITPAVKGIIVDSIESGVRLAVYKDDTRDYRTGGYSGQASYGRSNTVRNNSRPKNYDKVYGGYSGSRPPQEIRPSRPGGKNYMDNYVIPDRREALYILKTLRDHIYAYGSVSIAEYLDLLGVESDFTNYNYGWTNLVDVQIRSVRNGFTIDFPEIEVI